MTNYKGVLHCMKKALIDTIEHDGVEHAGYLSFLSLLSLFPFLVFFISLLGIIGESNTGENFVRIFLDSIPDHVSFALEPRIAEFISGPPQGFLTLAILGAIWTASSAVEGLRTILNRAYRVPTPPAYIWRRLMSIAQFIIITFIAVMTTFILVIIPVIMSKIADVTQLEAQFGKTFWHYLRYAVAAMILFFSAAFFYYVIPNIKQKLSKVFPGAVLTVILWFATGWLFSAYVNNFNQLNIIYGSLGGFIVTLIFFYIMAMIFIYGADFNHDLDDMRGDKVLFKEQVK